MFDMNTILTIVALGFVVAVLALVAYALYAVSPLHRHDDRFHDPGRPQASPRLD
jgi:Na+-transporting methylmalonyl-CoA/oxaloacetate decarboxylase gamma subunit